MPLEVILSQNGSTFSHMYLSLHFLEGKRIICDLIAYYLKKGENVKNLYFGCHGNRFLQVSKSRSDGLSINTKH